MGCCGKAKKKLKNIATGYYNLAKGTNSEKIKKRLQLCHGGQQKNELWLPKCVNFIGIGKKAGFCRLCGCFIPAKARVEDEHCPIGKW